MRLCKRGQVTLSGAARGGGNTRRRGSSCWIGNPTSVRAHFPIPDPAGGWLPRDAHTQLLCSPAQARTAFGPGLREACQVYHTPGPWTSRRLEGNSPLLPPCLVAPVAARPVCYPDSSQYRPGITGSTKTNWPNPTKLPRSERNP